MRELFRIPGIIALGPTTAGRSHHYMLFGARLLFLPLLLLTLAALALHLGAWRIEYKIAGPFETETNPARHSLSLAVPKETPAPWWKQPMLGDDTTKPFRSFLELRIDGREMGPPHSLHEAIRDGTTSGFSHWGSDVIFSLPPDIRNAPETIATIGYDVRPRAWVTFALIVMSTVLGCFRFPEVPRSLAWCSRALVSLAGPYIRLLTAGLVRIPNLILLGLCFLGLISSVVYVISSLYALVTGWALPTTALIRWSSIAQWVAENEPYFGNAIVMCAGLGAASTWLVGSHSLRLRSVVPNEQMLRRVLSWCGFPIAASAFVLCMSAMWAGMLRPGDFQYPNIGGLVPFSDAVTYLAAAHDQARDGIWNTVALHRPLAAALRSVLLFFGGYSLQSMLILQACLLAAAACFAAYAVAMWRGIWAGAAFFGLTYVYDRTFVPTTLTEPLGLFWALLSIPFFVEAFRRGSVRPALVAFAMTVVALMTRMGSMFTIPALLLWLVWQFGEGAAAKLRICAASICILVSVLVLNAGLQKIYGTTEGSTVGNFAYVLCGLTMGTGWEGCVAKATSEGRPLRGEEEVILAQLYSMARENFRSQPGIFFARLADGAEEFVTKLPDVIWGGYTTFIEKPPWPRNVLTVASLIGLLFIAARRARPVEWAFWALFWASTVLSAAIVYFDDGPRVLAGSYPLLAFFFAMGLSSPASISTEGYSRGQLSQYGLSGLLFAATLFVCVPWIVYRFSSIRVQGEHNFLPKQDEAFVFGGRRMSGFLVVEDGSALRSDVSTIHLADFAAIINQSGVEGNQGLLHPVMPALPFGFVYAPRLEKGFPSFNQFIVPAYVIERRNVPAWHFRLEPWRHNPSGRGIYWFYVTKAEPWPSPG
jgi:hypothetical protein